MSEERKAALRRMTLETKYQLRSRVNNALNKVLAREVPRLAWDVKLAVPMDDLELHADLDEAGAEEVNEIVRQLIHDKIDALIDQLPQRWPYATKFLVR